jgi:hypothetical protein
VKVNGYQSKNMIVIIVKMAKNIHSFVIIDGKITIGVFFHSLGIFFVNIL